ncbi:pirin family protein [Paenibacillus harenae]|uniref:pirin family protein n=1 Tax=Paenibacillus harenae TaxID=306543 RepID=UPI00278F3A0D|nr:pirin-like bicupin family protein [Paenibacillus harenae]MDQ0061847.1 redox-sensitive bicupin YhaK (pirin superfamily) [Paenibacillus harenae]
MMNLFPASERHVADLGWLRSYPAYSFGGYQDANRTGFSVMRVCNDDYIAPGRGFGAHPHSDMEIVSIVLNGRIRHEDNLGNRVVSSFGEVQRMSAGSGVIHTEFNDSDDEELRLLQLWFMPKQRGAAPSYEAKSFDTGKLHNALLPVVSDKPSAHTASIAQSMTIYLSKLDRDQPIRYEAAEGRNLFVYVIEGKLATLGHSLTAMDTAEIERERELTLTAEEDAFFMLVDLP